jgi:hypothetical protein
MAIVVGAGIGIGNNKWRVWATHIDEFQRYFDRKGIGSVRFEERQGNLGVWP